MKPWITTQIGHSFTGNTYFDYVQCLLLMHHISNIYYHSCVLRIKMKPWITTQIGHFFMGNVTHILNMCNVYYSYTTHQISVNIHVHLIKMRCTWERENECVNSINCVTNSIYVHLIKMRCTINCGTNSIYVHLIRSSKWDALLIASRTLFSVDHPQ